MPWHWRGRCVKLLDGTGLSMPDTAENQTRFPQPSSGWTYRRGGSSNLGESDWKDFFVARSRPGRALHGCHDSYQSGATVACASPNPTIPEARWATRSRFWRGTMFVTENERSGTPANDQCAIAVLRGSCARCTAGERFLSLGSTHPIGSQRRSPPGNPKMASQADASGC